MGRRTHRIVSRTSGKPSLAGLTALALLAAPAGALPPPPAPEAAAVVLPAEGSYLAPKLLRLAGQLTGLPVRVADRSLNELEVRVTRPLARRRVTLEELKVLLAAHSVYLHPWKHPEAGEMLVAARRPDWQPPAARFSRVLAVKEGSFERIAQAVEKAVAVRNRGLPPGSPPVVAVPSARTGKIFARAPSAQILDELEKLVKSLDHKDPERPHLFSYHARVKESEGLVSALLEKLSEGERQRVSIASGPGNLVLYRASPRLAEKIEQLLQELDQPGRLK